MRVGMTILNGSLYVYTFSYKRNIVEILWYVGDIYPQTDWILVIALARLDYQGCVGARCVIRNLLSLFFSFLSIFVVLPWSLIVLDCHAIYIV